jgi:hypothetical protein
MLKSKGQITVKFNVPIESGDIHERGVETLNLGEKSRVVPSDAVTRINKSLMNLGVKKPSHFIGDSISSRKLLDSFGVPQEYEDSQDRIRGYSFPSRFRLILIEHPTYNLAWSDIPMFSFCLGLNRTRHDPKYGYTPQFWKKQTGPPCSSRPTSEWAPKDERRYPMPWSYRDDYGGYDATCWAHFHLLFPKNQPPFLWLSALQNELLRYDDEVLPELRRLEQKAKSKWKGHYRRIIGAWEDNLNLEFPYAFAYPNRVLLLPVIGLKIAHDLAVGTYAMHSTAGYGGSHDAIYTQSCDLLKKCKTGIEIKYPTAITRQVVEKQ